MKILPVLTCAILFMPPAWATNDTAATMGYGVTTCAQFAQYYQTNVVVEQEYFNWAQGYMSGVNTLFATVKVATRVWTHKRFGIHRGLDL